MNVALVATESATRSKIALRVPMTAFLQYAEMASAKRAMAKTA